MYVPRAFRIDRKEAARFLAGMASVQLVTVRDGQPVATHQPVEPVSFPADALPAVCPGRTRAEGTCLPQNTPIHGLASNWPVSCCY